MTNGVLALGRVVGLLALGNAACTAGAETRALSAAAAAPSASATPAPPVAAAINAGQCPAEARIDDGEDGDAMILPFDQRSGSWSTYQGKADSTLEPAAGTAFAMTRGGANGSQYAARIHGKTAASGEAWVGLALSFTDPPRAYDASCCQGISFWAKKGQESSEMVRLNVGDGNTVPEGGVCKNCYNEFGVGLGFTEQWKQFTIPFAWLHQQSGWGEPFERLASDRLFHLHWEISYRDHTYDIWVDDVQLVGCAGH
jgi:endoglucanase